ncbi:MAG: hypothetical protein JOZ45_18870 [Acidobacteriaceae bacterium]|nr:hypothetical protein [Acidobacteriaceae bacterium]MBV9308216.1 hypothetical protein [Acidobacteriaceae bacterium]
MSATHRCRYCQQPFQPSPYRPQQTVCSQADCQRRRRSEYHRQRLQTDSEYRQVCLDSPRKWRARHPDYWQHYRETHPEVVTANRRKQWQRDQARRLADLANNHLAFDLKRSAAEVYWIGPRAGDLANNNVASGQVFVLEAVLRQAGTPMSSCKQQPSGVNPLSVG